MLPFWVSVSPAQDHDAELVNRLTNIVIKNEKLTQTESFELQINNRKGEEYANITIPYSDMIRVSKIKGHIEDMNGNVVRELKNREISDRHSVTPYFYKEQYIKEFSLKHNAFPYRIVWSYEIKQKEFIVLDYWSPVYAYDIPTQKAVLRIEIPADYKIAYKHRGIDDFETYSFGQVRRYRWDASYAEQIKSEKYSPPLQEFKPMVKVVPESFEYEKPGSFESWKSFGNWQYELIKDLTDLPRDEQKRILAIVEGVEDKREKIKRLYHYLQDETRYINVSMETGGLKPYPAAYVAHNKYGECKALTNYFKSMLEFVGIPNYYTLVYAGSPKKAVDKKFPSPQANHVIMCIPMKTDTIWLDCTSKAAFNYLGTFTQNREALIVDKDNSHFVHTPALSQDEVLETRTVAINYRSQNAAKVQFHNTYRGDLYTRLLHLTKNYSTAQQVKLIRDKVVADGFDLQEYKLFKPHRDTAKIRLFYLARSNKLFEHVGDEMLMHVIPLAVPSFEPPEKRTLPVQLDYPIYKIDTLTYQIPEGYYLSSDLQSADISNEFGHYKLSSSQHGRTVQIVKSLLIRSGYYANESYRTFYHFLSKIKENENLTYVLTSKSKQQ